jgi:hypothetical protein
MITIGAWAPFLIPEKSWHEKILKKFFPPQGRGKEEFKILDF